MKQRRQLEEQAEAEKKKRLSVTLDLMGRKVRGSYSFYACISELRHSRNVILIHVPLTSGYYAKLCLKLF